MPKQITSQISHTYEINKSKFICVLCPYYEFDKVMNKLREEHPKGRHFVYAYRHINEFDQIVENQSDDGEPKGSSGPPSLSVLRGEELVESGAIIVRYFGGIKLGVGGLIRAYGKSVHLTLEKAIEENAVQNYIKQNECKYKITIKNLGKFEHFLKDFDNLIIKKEFLGLDVVFSIIATEGQHIQIESFTEKLNF